MLNQVIIVGRLKEIIKMKSTKTILVALVSLLALSSCGDDKITTERGKVKFETISLSSKLGGRISKIYQGCY